MPIRRWTGWAAICRMCGKAVDLGDGYYAFEHRDEVKECLDVASYQTINEAITETCGCARE